MNKSIAILISGEGTNLQAFIDAQKEQLLQGKIAVVISNQPQAKGLKRAQLANIPSDTINHKDFKNRDEFDYALSKTIDKYQPDLIVLAGFMRILGTPFVTKYQSKLVNIHPSLLPKFTGLNTHQKALDANETEHGCSIHFVTDELDGGPVFAQAKVKVSQQDNKHTLANKVHQLEHQLYVKCVNLLLSNRLTLNNQKVFYNNEPLIGTIGL
ncbi:MAG: phosphoribosylglycinamide formyltransferase [Enterobacterales bacterium]|nr:phosphoribosylglycinamide formyltransferase [Enterobacterales bacterium]